MRQITEAIHAARDIVEKEEAAMYTASEVMSAPHEQGARVTLARELILGAVDATHQTSHNAQMDIPNIAGSTAAGAMLGTPSGEQRAAVATALMTVAVDTEDTTVALPFRAALIQNIAAGIAIGLGARATKTERENVAGMTIATAMGGADVGSELTIAEAVANGSVQTAEGTIALEQEDLVRYVARQVMEHKRGSIPTRTFAEAVMKGLLPAAQTHEAMRMLVDGIIEGTQEADKADMRRDLAVMGIRSLALTIRAVMPSFRLGLLEDSSQISEQADAAMDLAGNTLDARVRQAQAIIGEVRAAAMDDSVLGAAHPDKVAKMVGLAAHGAMMSARRMSSEDQRAIAHTLISQVLPDPALTQAVAKAIISASPADRMPDIKAAVIDAARGQAAAPNKAAMLGILEGEGAAKADIAVDRGSGAGAHNDISRQTPAGEAAAAGVARGREIGGRAVMAAAAAVPSAIGRPAAAATTASARHQAEHRPQAGTVSAGLEAGARVPARDGAQVVAAAGGAGTSVLVATGGGAGAFVDSMLAHHVVLSPGAPAVPPPPPTPQRPNSAGGRGGPAAGAEGRS